MPLTRIRGPRSPSRRTLAVADLDDVVVMQLLHELLRHNGTTNTLSGIEIVVVAIVINPQVEQRLLIVVKAQQKAPRIVDPPDKDFADLITRLSCSSVPAHSYISAMSCPPRSERAG